MANKKPHEKFPAAPSVVAEELLEPVLSFLQQAGISEDEAAEAFRSAWARSSKAKTKSARVALQSLTDPQPYVDLIAAWSRNSAFLDEEGLPRDLSMRGKNGFGAMVKAVAPTLAPQQAAALLHTYGNVEKLANGRLRLTKPFLHIKSDRQLAFEPSVRFLLDAARNVKASLQNRGDKSERAKDTEGFWRTVDTNQLPRSRQKAYLKFVKALSLTFLQDVDDWLSENSPSSLSASKGYRVGLGLFTIGAAPE